MSTDYSIIETSGKQIKVKAGDKITVNRIPDIKDGDTVTFDKVVANSTGGNITVGNPYIDSAKVNATLIKQVKGDKLVAFKYKRRKGYHRTVGHRQKLSLLKF